MSSPLRIFVSSPGDVREERLRAQLVIAKLARDYAGLVEVVPYFWESEPLRASGHFQDEIEPPSHHDIVVLILWSRLGTPLPVRTALREYRGIDGRSPVTGTEWEFEDALAAFQANSTPDLLVYRRDGDPGASLTDAALRAEQERQWQALQGFWARHFENRGAFLAASARYDSLDAFDARLEADLAKLIERRIRADAQDGEAAPLHLKGPPYRGLAAYDFSDAAVFFGRDGAVRSGLLRLSEAAAKTPDRACAFLMVLGASGSGKSSLARAGLLPALVAAKAVPGIGLWRRVVMRPGDAGADPVAALAAALLAGRGTQGEGLAELSGPGADAGALARHLRASVEDASYPFRTALGALAERERGTRALLAHEEARLVLLVDQLEELFTRPDIAEADRLAFLRLLAGLARSGLVWVIATMRSDLWHLAAAIPELLALTEEGARLDLLPPDGAELLEMIRRPARATGLSFEENEARLGLDAVLADAAAAEPGALPLLSVVLEDLYRRDVTEGGGRRLGFASYRAMGELTGAIATRAETAWRGLEARDPEAAAALPAVLRALVTASTGEAVTARAAPLAAFAAGGPAARLIAAFTAPEVRLLVTEARGGEPGAEAVLRLAHEALLAHWPRARDQIARDRRDLETRGRLESLYRGYAALPLGKARARALLTGLPLEEGIDLVRRWGIPVAEPLGAFVAASARRARARRSRAYAVAAALVLVFAGIAAFALSQSRTALRLADLARSETERANLRTQEAEREQAEAERQKAEAERQRGVAETEKSRADENATQAHRAEAATLHRLWESHRNESLSLAERAQREREAGDPRQAMRTALAALPADPDRPDRPFLAEAHLALTRAWVEDRLLAVLPTGDQVNDAVFSPDGATLLTSGRDGLLTAWDAATGRQRRQVKAGRLAAFRTIFSPDGRLIATVYQEPLSVIVRDAESLQVVRDIQIEGVSYVQHIAFTADGAAVVATSASFLGTPHVYDLRDGRLTRTLQRTNVPDLTPVSGLDVSPDGQWVALTDAGVTLWRLSDGRVQLSSPNPPGPSGEPAALFKAPDKASGTEQPTIRGLAFLHDGSAVLLQGAEAVYRVALADRRVTGTWPAASERTFGFKVTPDDAYAVMVASPTELGVLSLEQGSVVSLRGHVAPIEVMALSPDGRLAAALARDATVRVWEVRSGKTFAVLRAGDRPGGLAFSPDSRRLTTYGGDGARVFDMRADAEREQVDGLPPGWRLAGADAAGLVALATRARRDDRRATGDDAGAPALFDLARRRLTPLPNPGPWTTDLSESHFTLDGRHLALRRSLPWASRQEGDAAAARDALAGMLGMARAATLPEVLAADEAAVTELRDGRDGGLLGLLPGTAEGDRLAVSEDAGHACFWHQWGEDGKTPAEIWDLRSNRRVARLSVPGEPRGCAMRAGRAVIEAQAGFDAKLTFTVVDLATGRSLAPIEAAVQQDTELAFPGDGRTLLAQSRNHAPVLVDLETGAPLAGWPIPMLGAPLVTTGADRRSVAIKRDDDSWSVWNLETPRLVDRIPGGDTSKSVIYSEDGRRLAVRAYEKTEPIRVIEAVTGREIARLPNPDSGLYRNLLLDATGRHLALDEGAGGIRIHAVGDEGPTRRLPGDGSDLLAWSFAAEGTRFVTVAASGTCAIWDIAAAEPPAETPAETPAKPLLKERCPATDALRLLGNGRSDYIGWQAQTGAAAIYDTRAARAVWRPEANEVRQLALAAGAARFVVAGPARVEVRALPGGALLAALPFDAEVLKAIEIAPDGGRAVLLGREAGSQLVDLTGARAPVPLAGLTALQFAPGDTGLVALAAGTTLTLARAQDGTALFAHVFEAPIVRLGFHLSGTALVVALGNGGVFWIDTLAQAVRPIAKGWSEPEWVGAGFAREDVLILERSGGLTLRRAPDGALRTDFAGHWAGPAEPSGGRWLTRLDPAGERVGVLTPDNYLRLYRLADGAETDWYRWPGNDYVDFAFLTGGNLALVTRTGKLEFRDTRQRTSLRVLALPGSFDRFQDAAVTASGERVLAVSKDGRVSVASPVLGLLGTFGTAGAYGVAVAAALSADGALLATLDQDGRLRLWDIASRGLVLERTIEGWSGLSRPEIRFTPDDGALRLRAFLKEPVLVPVPPQRARLVARVRARLEEGAAPGGEGGAAGTGRLGVAMVTARGRAGEGAKDGAEDGALIREILPNGAAAQAGLLVGDIITRFGDAPVRAAADLSKAVAGARGTAADIAVLRGGRPLRLRAYID